MKKLNLLFLLLGFAPIFAFADTTGSVASGSIATGNVSTGSISTGTITTGTVSTGTDVATTGVVTNSGISVTTSEIDIDISSVGFLDVKYETGVTFDTTGWNNFSKGIISQITGIDNKIYDLWSGIDDKYPNSKSMKWNYSDTAPQKTISILFKSKNQSDYDFFKKLMQMYKSGTGDAVNDYYIPRMKSLTKYYSDLAVYIDSGTIDSYNQYVQDMMNAYKEDSKSRVDRFNLFKKMLFYRRQMCHDVFSLNNGVYDKFFSIISRIPDEKKINSLTKLVKNIDARIFQIKNSEKYSKSALTRIYYLQGLKYVAEDTLDIYVALIVNMSDAKDSYGIED